MAGRYAAWSSDVTNRYPRVATTAESRTVAILESAYLTPAEDELDARLSVAFAIPFSSNNRTVQDLVIDMTVLRFGFFKEEAFTRMQESIDSRIKMLIDGTMVMVTSGGVLGAQAAGQAFSTVNDYPPTFGLGEIEGARPSSQRLEDEEDARDEL